MSRYRSLTVLQSLRADNGNVRYLRDRNSPRTSTPRRRYSLTIPAAMVGAGVIAAICATSVGMFFIALFFGAALGVLFSEARKRRVLAENKRKLDYYLRIVMERLVMAVESSLDVLPAIAAVVELDRQRGTSIDPVTMLLWKIQQHCDAGEGFLEALQQAQHSVSSPSVKHALVHLGIAYREGGEIVQPLRELSDATQLQYQESVEEEIAKMPVKATAPLLCTFAGLIILFLTSPLIQIMKISGQAMPQ